MKFYDMELDFYFFLLGSHDVVNIIFQDYKCIGLDFQVGGRGSGHIVVI
jgi:hypothetical protein